MICITSDRSNPSKYAKLCKIASQWPSTVNMTTALITYFGVDLFSRCLRLAIAMMLPTFRTHFPPELYCFLWLGCSLVLPHLTCNYSFTSSWTRGGAEMKLLVRSRRLFLWFVMALLSSTLVRPGEAVPGRLNLGAWRTVYSFTYCT